MPPRVLLVDNYDSYTYNLYQLIGQVTGVPPVVVLGDALDPTEQIDREFTHIVVSPGPGHPHAAPGCLELIAGTRLPLLGVCLGHQAIAVAFGGTVTAVPPRHGYVSTIEHDARGVLAGLPQGLRAVRYHSLAVTRMPEALEVAGRAEDGTVMALRHRERPLHGVQFHPESVASTHGRQLLANFLLANPGAPRSPAPRSAAPRSAGRARLLVREAPWRDPEDVFVAHYAHQPYTCWLDSADARPGERRFSYLGAPEGPRGHVLTAPRIFERLAAGVRERAVDPGQAPFPFHGGYLGYLGYELDDAAFLYVERFLAFDHDARRVYAAALARQGEEPAARAWLREATARVRATRRADPPSRDGTMSPIVSTMDDDGYARAFAIVQRHLHLGDSYEVNLTYRLAFTCTARHTELYRHLRRTNPAPHAAFLRVPGTSVLCSSPERFLRVGPHGTVEARPIKGTLPRHPDPYADAVLRERLGKDPKTFAENLMIVDLLRNDLGQVCELGTVAVPELMAVESYPTVHQLVSTVTGVLAPGTGAVAAVRAAFPAGSMTGAPKLRTMQIIDEVEHDPRGVYSGALGYFSLSGEADLAVVIRTIVARGTGMTIGVGGGVVTLSQVADERAEAQLKAAALVEAARRACAAQELAVPLTLITAHGPQLH